MNQIVVRAPDSQAAMDEVLRRLGEQALILSTAHVNGQVEIRATADPTPRRVVTAQVVPAVVPRATGGRGRQADGGLAGQGPAGTAQAAAHSLLRPRPDAALARLRAALIEPAADIDLTGDPPRRVIVAGAPGSGKSLLAARIVAALRLADPGRMVRLVAPWRDLPLAGDRLQGWARLMGLGIDRPRIDAFLSDPAFLPPAQGATQVIDLSDLPGADATTLAEMAAPVGSLTLVCLPAGQSARAIAAALSPWREARPFGALTRTDLCPPGRDELEAIARLGLPLALVGEGTGILDALRRAGLADLQAWLAADPEPAVPAVAPAPLTEVN